MAPLARKVVSVPPASRSSVGRVLSGRLVKYLPSLALALPCAIGVAAQAPATIDTSAIGPQVGATAPGFSGTDQFGRSHTLESSLRANGAMLVFFRSADW